MNGPFDRLSEAEKSQLYELLGVHIYNFKKDSEIFPTLKRRNIVGIILKGCAQILNVEYNGNVIVLETLGQNSIFSSSMTAIHIENYIIIAREATSVLLIDYVSLMKPENLSHSCFNIFLSNLFDIMNVKFKKANERMKVLEEKQIRNKLLMYFDIEYRKTRLKHIELPFSWKEFADYIAVNRTAMFREIKNMKEEGVIAVRNRRITLLYKSNSLLDQYSEKG